MRFFSLTSAAPPEIYTLSLHDALPISTTLPHRVSDPAGHWRIRRHDAHDRPPHHPRPGDRKSTRLNSSHLVISYAVFCLKKKKNTNQHIEILTTPPPPHTLHPYTTPPN